MKAELETDRTVRTIRVRISGVPDIDVTRSWHKKPRLFRPEIVNVQVVDGELSEVTVVGGLVLKSGKCSEGVTESRHYTARGWNSDSLLQMPEWLTLLTDEAMAGVTSWGGGEVQAL